MVQYLLVQRRPDPVGCVCNSVFPADFIDCGETQYGDHLWRDRCGQLYVEHIEDGTGEIWAASADDELTSEESLRGCI